MRTFLIACFVLAAVSVLGHSGEQTSQMWFCDGVYAVDIADGWSYDEDASGEIVSFKHAEHPVSLMFITTPNPVTGKTNKQLVEMMIKTMAEGADMPYEVANSEERTLFGHPSYKSLMVVPDKEDPKLFFMGEAVDFDGYQVVLIGMTTADELEAGFGDASSKLLESYTFNKDKADEHKDKLETIGKAMNESFE